MSNGGKRIDHTTGVRPGDNEVLCPHCGQVHPIAWTHCPNTGKPLAVGPALVGRVIADRYRVLDLIGEGGMGAVYEAEHIGVGRRVALKRLHPELAADEDAVKRFQREARTAARTGHEHIVDVLDIGFTDDGAPFLVMELLQGENLAQRLGREGTLPPDRIANIVGQVLRALDAVHRQRVVHRDLKPDNIFLTKRGAQREYVKVLDFGVAKMRAAELDESVLTHTGAIVGTPHYMSPEQARGAQDVDHRVDLYACGCILYEALSGELPFRGDNYHALLQAILGGTPTNLTVLIPTLPIGLTRVVHRAMARDPADRFSDARELLEALVPFGALPPRPSEVPERDEKPERPSRPLPNSIQRSRFTPKPDLAFTRTPNLTARGYEATSRDWDEYQARALQPPLHIPSPSVRSSNPTATSAATTSGLPDAPYSKPARKRDRIRERRPSFQSMLPDRPSGRARVKAGFVLGAIAHLTETYGEDTLQRALREAPLEVRRGLQGVLLPVTWVPLNFLHELLDGVHREFGAEAVAQLGAGVADRELQRTHKLLMRSATPQNAPDRIAQLWCAYFEAGDVQVDYSDEKATVRILNADDTPLHLRAAAAFFVRMMEQVGAHEVRSTSLHRTPIDGSTIQLTWRI